MTMSRQGIRTTSALLLVLAPVAAPADDEALQRVSSIGVYTVVDKSDAIAPDVSVFLAGYLENVKGYTAYNLDQYYVHSERAARARAVELGAEAVLAAKVEGFKEYENTAKAKLRLIDAERGKKLKSWKAKLRAPFFDPPTYLHIEPYGNLDEVFRELPARTHEIQRHLQLLVLSDQYLEGPGETTRAYLESQLAIASRTLTREFGIALEIHRMERWIPPAVDIFTIAEAAAGLPARDEVDLTLVCVGPPAPAPAPARSWEPAREGTRAMGYARVLTNIVVNRVMNAQVFVHEIGHVLGAIHIEREGCVMEPAIRTFRIAGRFRVLPPILFSATNRRIIDLTRSIPLGAKREPHQEKINRLLGVYEELEEKHLRDVAPYYGDLLLSLGRHAEAIDILQAGQQVDPNSLSIRYSLRQALVESGRYAEAQRMLQEDFNLRRSGLQHTSRGRSTLQDFALIKVAPAIVPFGTVHVGQRETRRLTIANLGTLPLELSSNAVTEPPFWLAEHTPSRAVVKPGETLAVGVEYRPVSAGLHAANLRIESNAMGDDGLKEIRLTGQGEE